MFSLDVTLASVALLMLETATATGEHNLADPRLFLEENNCNHYTRAFLVESHSDE
jgi:hypothetical protein